MTVPVLAIGLAVAAAACGSGHSASGSADKLVNAGLSADESGHQAQAVADYQAAIKADPLQVYAYYDLGVAYQQRDDVADSAAAYQKALLLNPRYKSALFNLAVLETPGSPPTALGDYRQLLSFDPGDANVLFNMGILERQLGDTAAGNADLARAVKINPALGPRIPLTATQRQPASSSTTTPQP